MNTKQIRQFRTAALATAIVAIVTMTAGPATAQHTRKATARPRCPAPVPWPTGTPLAALDGRTLAQYVQDHQAHGTPHGDDRLSGRRGLPVLGSPRLHAQDPVVAASGSPRPSRLLVVTHSEPSGAP